MRAAVVLQARMGSTRLPGKALVDITGRPLLQHCVDRLRVSGLPVVIATTTAPGDDQIAALGRQLGVAVVRGATDDVLARFVQVADTLGLEAIVRATGDNPAVDVDAPRRTLDLLCRAGADHVVEQGLPYGCAVEAVSVDALRRAAEWTADAWDREHVTPFIKRDGRFRVFDAIAPGLVRRPALRLTVDTPDDLEYVRRLFAQFDPQLDHPVPLRLLIEAADATHRTRDGAGSGVRGAR